MQFTFNYDKRKVIHGLRLHFVSLKEIKWLMIIINVFVILSAVLLYTKKIRPEPFLLGTFIWLIILVSVWFIMPHMVYKKSATFKNNFLASVTESELRIETENSFVNWPWSQFTHFFESPHFFHLYFDKKSFFLVPKDHLTEDIRHEFRATLNKKIVQ